MNSLTSLSPPDLCQAVVDTAKIFSDAYVSEALREAQEQMGKDPAISTALAAFASTIAPVLLGDKHKSSTLSLLRALKGKTDGGADTIRDLFSLVLMDKEFITLAAAIRGHGEGPVLAALYKYGTPPTMDMLSSLLETQANQQHWRTYMADMLCLSVRALFGKNGSTIPLYSEIIRRDSAKDSRSGKEILDHVKESLRKRIEKRKEHKTE